MSLQSANHQKHNFSDRQKLSLKNMKNQKKTETDVESSMEL